MAKKVFLAIGHGGKDPGAVANGLREADINLAMGIAAQAELVRHGVVVLMSRTSDVNDPLEDEIREANAFEPDLVVGLHNNAGGGNGWEAYVPTNRFGTSSKALAEAIEKEVKALGQNSRGIKTRLNAMGADYFGLLREVAATVVLLEGAFLDSSDRFIIDTVEEQRAFGMAYAKGILAHLGIPWKPQSASCNHNGLTQENARLKEQLKAKDKLLQSFKALAARI